MLHPSGLSTSSAPPLWHMQPCLTVQDVLQTDWWEDQAWRMGVASFLRWHSAGNVQTVEEMNSTEKFKSIYLSYQWLHRECQDMCQVQSRSHGIHFGMCKKGKVQKNLRARHHLSLDALVWPAAPSGIEKMLLLLCVCVYVDCTSPFFFLFHFQQEGHMTEQNLKSTTLTRLCVWCCFMNKVQNGEAVWGLAEVQKLLSLLISRQPMGLCFLFSISSAVQKCALSLVFILGSLT